MLTRLLIRNFKRFEDVDVELGKAVVFIGPNNSGKTTALQALALWDIGLRKWNEKRKGKETPEVRSGVTINRGDLIAVPVPEANLLWRGLHVRSSQIQDGKQQTRNIRTDITVHGVTGGQTWVCGLEFDYANDESFYCRPLRLSEGKNPERMPIPDVSSAVRVGFLPPMSGLAAVEDRLDPGAIHRRLGEGRTAEVLRNLCLQVLTDAEGRERWAKLKGRIGRLFGVFLEEPQYLPERGEVRMSYRDGWSADGLDPPRGPRLDLSSSGRGLQQTLLLLAYLSANPGTVLLLDEPDAHLEILRQRQIYQILTDAASEQRSQIIAASHSEIVLNEAADRDVVVAFVGKPHRIDDRGSQVLKSLKSIGFEQYYRAEVRGWVLYLEGATDLAILRAFARTLGHPAQECLESPFVHYVQNQPSLARDHFHGLREAKADLTGFALFDRIEGGLHEHDVPHQHMWTRREIENYLAQPETLLAYAEAAAADATAGPIFEHSDRERWRDAMKECIEDLVPRAAMRDRKDPFWRDTKASDGFLDRLMQAFSKKLELPNLMRKTDYHVLADHVPRDQIDPEVEVVLDAIVGTAKAARPVGEA
jgi:hypothetical protein